MDNGIGPSSMAERALFRRLMSNEDHRGVQEGANHFHRPTTQTLHENSISSLIHTGSNTAEYDNYIRMLAYQPETAASVVMAQQQQQRNLWDMALLRCGYAFPPMAPSVTNMLNNPNSTISRDASQLSAVAAQGNISYSSLTTRPYQSCQSRSPQFEWSSNLYLRSGIEDWMLMNMYRPSQLNLHSFGTRDSAQARESNLSSQLSSIPPQAHLPGASTAPSPQASSASRDQDQASRKNINNHPSTLAIPSDGAFLGPVHIFLRSTCIELFVSTKDHLICP
eukprot:CAMPEP_0172542384 /NCGR_PEP_ID=MMETSP1067-20121228/13008_1 /TAXON_ID=265564 ORGANISM="Thalassiosira punctigera, Strain Tpunct2005C2" /NCGR_SAMPLE_ID=MMETSP1067 /ASSEMBLY_ACC=CAM_ASM_000444 /LENGTH=279 /DNA_ID=CAMNT_0013328617 /DNA_START=106 /DNA_END=941 /DNA_ORIENTATION=-